jgi:hypothetical protein
VQYRAHIERSPDGAPLCEVIVPTEKLADKVGLGRGFDAALLQEVSRDVAALGTEYVSEAILDVERMGAALHGANRAGSDIDARRYLNEIRCLAHDVRGLGGSFDFPLVTQIASRLYDVLDEYPDLPQQCLDLIGVHVGALRVILSQQLRGDGGDVGRELLSGLRDASARRLRAGDSV